MTPDRIEEGLWLGPQPLSPEDFDTLRDLGASDILTLMTEEESLDSGIHPSVLARVAMAKGITLHRVEIPDFSHTALVQRLPAALQLLQRLRAKGRAVYVHCAAGRNRSPTLVAAYLAVSRGLTPEAACAKVCLLHPPSFPDIDAVRSAVGHS